MGASVLNLHLSRPVSASTAQERPVAVEGIMEDRSTTSAGESPSLLFAVRPAIGEVTPGELDSP